MNNSIYPLLFCMLFIFSCDEKDEPATVCGVVDSAENLPWLKSMVEESAAGGLSEFSYITQAKYKGKRVFYQGSCCPNCSWALILYDCEGKRINEEVSFSDLEDSVVIWQPEGSQCDFD